MVSQNISLLRLQAFEATARLGSLKDAADEIGVTPSAISHRLKDLESDIGVSLFVKDRRRISFTPEGKELAITLHSAFSSIKRQISTLQLSQKASSLTVSCAPAFANKYILPNLPDFQKRNPSISLSVIGTNERAEMSHGAVDAAIRFSRNPVGNLYKKTLMTVEGYVVGSPELVKHALAQDVIDAPRISITHLPNTWREHIRHSEFRFADIPSELSFESLESAVHATVEGAGLSLVPKIFIERELSQNKLAVLETVKFETNYSYSLIAPKDPIKKGHIDTFARWLQKQIRAKEH